MKSPRIKYVKRSDVPEMDDLMDSLNDFLIGSRVNVDEALSVMANMIVHLSVNHISETDFNEFIRMLMNSYSMNLRRKEGE